MCWERNTMLLCNPEHKVSGVEGGQAHAGAPPPRRMKAHEVHCDEAQRTNGMTQLGNTGRASSPAATEGCDKDGKGAAPLGGAAGSAPGLPKVPPIKSPPPRRPGRAEEV